MATLNTTAALKSATKVAGELTLDFTQLTDITFSDATGDSATIATGSFTTIVDGTHSDETYVYVKNTGVNRVKLFDTSVEYGSVNPGCWVFFAVPASKILKLQAVTAPVACNYLTFKV
tara:strand:+ start:217 stop:570 length:354 start_codon:yes stop_codon:yes gene_type:complete